MILRSDLPSGVDQGREYRCDVLAGEEGRARYRLTDGREFRTPSGAGSAVMGGVACNGWRFWNVAGPEKTKPVRSTTKRGKRSARSLGKTRPQRKVRVQGNGYKPEVR
jgi:hypothetical protein